MPIILVTGGNRGIGLEACRALSRRGATVLLGARREADAVRAAAEAASKGEVHPVLVDLADGASVAALKVLVEARFGTLDALVNNAAVCLDGKTSGRNSLFEIDENLLKTTLDANLVGAWRMIKAFVPAMKTAGRGRVVNVSSGMGAISEMGGGTAAYRISKTGLNALTLILAAELEGTGVTAVSLCPGWVRTRMGGPAAPRRPEDAGEAIAAAVLDDKRNGVFLRDGKEIAW